MLIIGAGTLAMPSAMSHFGMTLGVIVIVWSAFTSALGLYLQSRCARYLDRGTASFSAVAQMTYPNAAIIFEGAIAVKCFGVAVSYLIIIGDLMPGVIEGFDSRATAIPYLMNRNFWITIFMLVIMPLAFLRRLDSLKYTSIVALVAIGYLIVLVVYHFASDTLAPRDKVRYVGWGGPIEALSALPVVVFAYTCHQNKFSILNELKDNSPSSIMGVITASIGSAASVYVLVAITGYMTFGNDVEGNIVSMYPPSTASTIGKAAIVVLVTFSIPLQVHPCRASIYAVTQWRPSGSSQARSNSPGSRSLLAPSQNRNGDHSSGAEISDAVFAWLTSVILILAYITSLTVSSLERVLAFVGSVGSTSISFILPGIFYWKISHPDSGHQQRLAKEDDDATSRNAADDDSDDDVGGNDGDGLLGASTGSIRSMGSGVSGRSARSGRGRNVNSPWRWRTKWRWNMEHLTEAFLRQAAGFLAVYGVCVLVVCLTLNTIGSIKH
ncbi:hypothetical protein SLS62_005487 [Diatrype stigma]|uniref:Amino acid transporter transmembrane domain-containing protein n=1 Tax=Diatrype stigma TaxID=117547 RepID=A0AAN9V0E5_9PEZI